MGKHIWSMREIQTLPMDVLPRIPLWCLHPPEESTQRVPTRASQAEQVSQCLDRVPSEPSKAHTEGIQSFTQLYQDLGISHGGGPP